MWKVDLWRRRRPPIDLGSAHNYQPDEAVFGRLTLTVRIELQDLQVHVGIGDDHVELLFEGEELGAHYFELVFAPAEEHHLVWLFLISF